MSLIFAIVSLAYFHFFDARLKVKEASRLQSEYERLVQGLTRIRPTTLVADEVVPCPVLPADLVSEAIPGNIRKAEHFLSFIRRWVEFLKVGS